ncbi:MAG TPA: DoxX family membrane protein [Candidatus Saccharimonadales bacterium]|nr:DoxX family membrane protein [Candidatus Saccharimonadales bacterium]
MLKLSKNLHNPNMAQWLLRIGLAAVFAYAGVRSLQRPLEWAGYLPGFLLNSGHAVGVVKSFAVFELLVAAWLLAGKCLRLAALMAFLMLAGILVSTPSQLIITFRDIGLAAMAAALFFLV